MKFLEVAGRRSQVAGAWRFLLFGVLVGMIVLVGAATWIEASYNVTYWTSEEVPYIHNLSVNVTGFEEGDGFSISPGGTDDIYWNGIIVNLTDIEDWIFIENSSTGNLTIKAIYDNQTGAFILPLKVTQGGGSTIVPFNFTVNATNDAPNFSLSSDYNVSVSVVGNSSLNISLVGSDEEEQYPLEYNLSITGCELAGWSLKGDCNLSYDIISVSNTTSILAFSNLTYDYDVGDYNLTICSHDYFDLGSAPLYRDTDYDENKSYCQNTTLNLLASLSINISNCSGATVMEGEQFNCTINITTQGAGDELNISSFAILKNTSVYDSSNRDWFYEGIIDNASNNYYPISISISPNKNEVGNWTINFSVVDLTGGGSETAQIDIYVNFTESSVTLDPIDDMILYEDNVSSVDGVDLDLLIWDDSVKLEVLTYASNTSWVSVTSPAKTTYGINYTRSVISVNHSEALLSGVGNHSVRINVTDAVGNPSESIFIIEIRNNSAPEWNASSYVYVSNETDNVYINLSEYVSDADDNVSDLVFSYVNDSRFDGFNLTSEGIINFSSSNVDVGEHLLNISVSDTKLSSDAVFNFTIYNVVDAPVIDSVNPPGVVNVLEDSLGWVNITILDDDFLILQKSFYDENLSINLTFNNLTNVVSLISFDFVLTNILDNQVDYRANFTPDGENVGVYNVTFNITDKGNFSDVVYFILNITDANDAPNLTLVENLSLTVNDVLNLNVNATDEEDGNDTLGVLRFSLDFIYGDDFVNGNESVFNTTSGIFNLSLNSSLAGEYRINVTVNDSIGAEDFQVFYFYVYGAPNITSPFWDYKFSWNESVLESLNFTVDYAVNDSNLTYEFFMDGVVYYWVNESNGTKDFNYTNLTLRGDGNFIWNSSVNLSFDYLPDYLSESYGMLKNFSLLVYNPSYPELNNSLTWGVNVSHANENITFSPTISKKGPATVGAVISVDLEDYFNDSDYFDVYYNQKVNFSLETVGDGGYVVLGSSFSDWILNLESSSVAVETVKITAYEWSDDNVSLGSAESNDFEVEFIAPVVQASSGGSSSKVKLKFYSLRIIVPDDIIISDENYIEIPFGLENTGTIDLAGIDLASEVLYNNEFSDDVRIDLGETYVDVLKVGERRDYTMKILADTDRSGRYKATIFANITSPKFFDWADFFIDLRRTNESEAEELLIFTEKIIADNPECLELTEVFRRAKEAFEEGNEVLAMSIAEEVSAACEDAIKANEQVRYRIEGFVERNFYYISFVTLLIFFVGLIVFVYKRVRFNKSVEDEYVG